MKRVRKVRWILLLSCLSLLITGCGEDDYVYPNVVTTMGGLKTDETGTGRYLLTDEGKEWNVQAQAGLEGLKLDTVYRVVALYEPLSTHENEVKLYSIQQIVAPKPLPATKFKELKTDPVKLQSIWKSGRYLNLTLQVLAKDAAHNFHFIEDELVRAENGTQTLYLTLYHDRRNDVEGFYRKVYLSVPLWAYEDRLQPGDRIVFSLNTYQDGKIERVFTY